MREKMKRALLLFCLSLPAAGLSFAQGASTPLAKEPKIHPVRSLASDAGGSPAGTSGEATSNGIKVEQERVKFVDANGAVVKELSLAQEKRVDEREGMGWVVDRKTGESVQRIRKWKTWV